MELNRLSERFKTFSEKECAGSSELYEYLSRQIAEDEVMLELSSFAKKGQPIPNLFFAAVHYLLLKGNNHKLSLYYPSLAEQPQPPTESFPHFKDFCLTYRDQIIPILKEKLVQTNEVRRCGYLYPCFTYAYDKVQKPLALIEIGTSAGFQLLWDKYSYSYNSDEIYGDKNSTIHIQTEIKGENVPPLSKIIPPVARRYGLDLNINNLSDPEDSFWLNALIWPEHHKRRGLFKQAVNCVLEHRDELTFIEGDGVEMLPRMIEQIPNNLAVCIFHTHVANQMPEDVKHRLINTIKRISETRDVIHIYNNIWDGYLHLDSFISGFETSETIAETDGHGRWFEWKI